MDLLGTAYANAVCRATSWWSGPDDAAGADGSEETTEDIPSAVAASGSAGVAPALAPAPQAQRPRRKRKLAAMDDEWVPPESSADSSDEDQHETLSELQQPSSGGSSSTAGQSFATVFGSRSQQAVQIGAAQAGVRVQGQTLRVTDPAPAGSDAARNPQCRTSRMTSEHGRSYTQASCAAAETAFDQLVDAEKLTMPAIQTLLMSHLGMDVAHAPPWLVGPAAQRMLDEAQRQRAAGGLRQTPYIDLVMLCAKFEQQLADGAAAGFTGRVFEASGQFLGLGFGAEVLESNWNIMW
jgi:hypothetical protein